MSDRYRTTVTVVVIRSTYEKRSEFVFECRSVPRIGEVLQLGEEEMVVMSVKYEIDQLTGQDAIRVFARSMNL